MCRGGVFVDDNAVHFHVHFSLMLNHTRYLVRCTVDSGFHSRVCSA